jgi:hypothetical protein
MCPPKTTGLGVLASSQSALDHGDTADAGAQGHHDCIAKPAGRTRVGLSQQSHPRVILNTQRKAKRSQARARKSTPGASSYFLFVDTLARCGNRPDRGTPRGNALKGVERESLTFN